MKNPNHQKLRLGLGMLPGDIDRCTPATPTSIGLDLDYSKSIIIDATLGTGRPADIDRKPQHKKGE